MAADSFRAGYKGKVGDFRWLVLSFDIGLVLLTFVAATAAKANPQGSAQPPPTSLSSTPSEQPARSEQVSEAGPQTVPVWLETANTWAALIEAILTAAAILAGAWWTWRLFLRQRLHYPRANVEHRISHWPASENKRALHCAVRVMNVGSVLITFRSVMVRIYQLVPPPEEVQKALEKGDDPVASNEGEAPWEIIHERTCKWEDECYEIEPGESDEFLFDFFVDRSVAGIQVYSHLSNAKKSRRRILRNTYTYCQQRWKQTNEPTFGRYWDVFQRRQYGWNLSTIHDLTRKATYGDEKEGSETANSPQDEGTGSPKGEDPRTITGEAVGGEALVMSEKAKPAPVDKQGPPKAPGGTRQGPPKAQPRRPPKKG